MQEYILCWLHDFEEFAFKTLIATIFAGRPNIGFQTKWKLFANQEQNFLYASKLFCFNSKRESYEKILLIWQQHKIFFVPKCWQNIEPGNGRINPARICPFHLHTFVIVRCNFLPNGTFLSNRMISSGNFYPLKFFLMGSSIFARFEGSSSGQKFPKKSLCARSGLNYGPFECKTNAMPQS